MNRRIQLLIFSFLFIVNGFSNSKPNVTIYSTQNGLPNCQIIKTQYFQGILWVATEKGLFIKKQNYFDSASEVLSDKIDGDFIVSLHILKNNAAMYVVSQNAIYCISGEINNLNKFIITPICRNPFQITTLALRWDKDDILWTVGGNIVYCLNPNESNAFVAFAGYNYLDEDSLGNIILISSTGSLFKSKFKKAEIETTPMGFYGMAPYVKYIISEKEAKVYIGFHDTNRKYELRNLNKFVEYLNYIESSNATGKEKFNWTIENVNSVNDKIDNVILLSHSRCLVEVYISVNFLSPTHIVESCRGILHSINTNSTICATYGGLLVGTESNFNLMKIDSMKTQFYNLSLQTNDSGGFLFPELGACKPLYFNLVNNTFYEVKFKSTSNQYYLVRMQDGNYLFAGDSLLLYSINGDSLKFVNYIPNAYEKYHMVSEPINNCILVATKNELHIFNLKNNSSRWIANGDFRCVRVNRNSWIVGSDGEGIFLIDQDGHILRNDKSKYLNNIFSMEADYRPNFFWLGTKHGLLLYSLDQGIICKLDNFIGLNNTEFNTNSLKLVSNGDLYAGGLNGLDIIHSKLLFNELSKHNVISNLLLEVFENESIKSRFLVLNSKINKIQFEPGNISICVYFRNENIINRISGFQYRISNLDTTWKPFIPGDTLRFDNLTAGNYIMEMRTNLNSSDSYAISIFVPYIFWKSRLFVILKNIAFLVLLGLAFIFLRKMLVRYKDARLKAEMTNILELEANLKTLKFNINLHTFSNFLTSLQRLILEDKKTIATEMLSEYSTLIRFQMKYSEGYWVTISEEIRFLVKYIEIESHKLNYKLSYSINCKVPVPSDVLIPNMVLLPFVENAFKHGMNSLQYGTQDTLNLQFEMNKGVLECIVSNTVTETDYELNKQISRKGDGTKITERRMKLYSKLTKRKWSLKTSTYKNGKMVTTSVFIEMPYRFIDSDV